VAVENHFSGSILLTSITEEHYRDLEKREKLRKGLEKFASEVEPILDEYLK
jgi:hypothetical protein